MSQHGFSLSLAGLDVKMLTLPERGRETRSTELSVGGKEKEIFIDSLVRRGSHQQVQPVSRMSNVWAAVKSGRAWPRRPCLIPLFVIMFRAAWGRRMGDSSLSRGRKMALHITCTAPLTWLALCPVVTDKFREKYWRYIISCLEINRVCSLQESFAA